MSSWKECTLGDVLELQRGFDLPIQDRKSGTFPIIASTGVNGYHNEYKVKAPGVVIGRSGSIGGGQYVKSDFWPLNTTLWVKDFKGNNPRYCYYLLKNIDFKQFNVGSGVPTLNRNHIHPLKVKAPSNIETQHYIADTLGTIDDKIELNNQINETLELMAKAIFKEWFIDFAPVKANALGVRPFGMDDETAALFPDSFEDSELGKIPKGWTAEAYLNDVAVIGGGTPKTTVEEYWNGDIPWFSVADSPKDGDVWVIDTEKKITSEGLNSSSTKILDIGTSIITARGTVGKIALVGIQMAMNQSCYALKSKNGFSFYYYFLLQSLVASLKGRSHGSVFDTITTNTLASLDYIKPSSQLLRKFEDSVSPLLFQIKNNLQENKSLKSLRDILLPKLISGEIELEFFHG